MAKVEAKHVFKFIVEPKEWYLQKNVYTNIDFAKKHDDGNADYEHRTACLFNTEEEVKNLYFTKEVKEKIRRIFANMVLHGDIELDIQCTDWDGGYEIEEEELLENIVKIK